MSTSPDGESGSKLGSTRASVAGRRTPRHTCSRPAAPRGCGRASPRCIRPFRCHARRPGGYRGVHRCQTLQGRQHNHKTESECKRHESGMNALYPGIPIATSVRIDQWSCWSHKRTEGGSRAEVVNSQSLNATADRQQLGKLVADCVRGPRQQKGQGHAEKRMRPHPRRHSMRQCSLLF